MKYWIILSCIGIMFGTCFESSVTQEFCTVESGVANTFVISKYEVTNAEFKSFIRATGYREAGSDWLEAAKRSGWSASVRFISYYDAQAFCDWVDGRLPTEQEWEYAARGPEGHLFPWGDDDPYRLFRDNTMCDLKPVGSSQVDRSPFGCCDMAGNVREWTSSNSSNRTYAIRGGHFGASTAQSFLSTKRSSAPPSERSGRVGFRYVKN